MNETQRKAMFSNIHKKTGKSLSSKDLVGYDVKARRKVTIENPRLVQFKNGRYALKGESSVSGTKVCRII